MPNRILREGILTSSAVTRLGWAEEVFYRRLHSVVDDFGRYYADPGMLRAACYPRQLNKVSDSDIGKWLRACVDAALVRVYPAEDGECYLEVLKFGQQVRAKKSKFPDMRSTCVANASHLPANAHLDVSVSESVKTSEANASDASAAVDNFEVESAKAALWRESVVVLKAGGCPESLCRSFMGKLVKDYGEPVVRDAVTAAISAQPADAREYLKATCQRLKGERKDPVTVPSTDTGAEQFKAAMEERAAAATRPPAEVLALARRAVRTG